MADYLLDTHTYIWWVSDNRKLSEKVYNLIIDESNRIYLSVVSTWEISIKMQLGKLPFRDNLAEVVANNVKENNFQVLPVALEHTLKVGDLPLHHRDPFDRLLIAQAIVEDLTLLSKDANFPAYDANVVW